MTTQATKVAMPRPTTGERTPPNDITAETCVLGAMMLSKDVIAEVITEVRADDFYKPNNAIIYNAIVGLFSKGEPADVTTVAAALVDTGDFARIGGGTYLHDLVGSVPNAASGSYYARIVADRACLRRLVEAGTRISQIGYQPDAEAGSAADRAAQVFHAAVATRERTTTLSFRDLVRPAFDAIEEAGSHRGLRGLSTGLPELDARLGGLQADQLILIAARPSMGKSVLGVDIARAVAIRQRKPFLLFSLEMGSMELMTRMLAAECSIPLDNLKFGRLSDEQWTKMARRSGEIDDAPLFIDDTATMSILDIRAKARRIAQQHELACIGVDYLQLMSAVTGKRSDNREREVAEISRGLKLLAKELHIPVIAIAQLNRGPEMRTDKRPHLADLRESGSLENDADVVMLLHRPEYYDRDSPRRGEIDIDIQKNRNGERCVVTALAQLHFSRIVSASPEHEHWTGVAA